LGPEQVRIDAGNRPVSATPDNLIWTRQRSNVPNSVARRAVRGRSAPPALLVAVTIEVQTFAVGLLVRRKNSEFEPGASHQELERQFYRRATKWLGTSAITWSIWAFTGAPIWLPHATRTNHHLVVSAGIWPAYIMIGGLADLGRMARHLYVESPPFDTATDSADSE
jgi:hypothetical protein